jgi:hypothetical protein
MSHSRIILTLLGVVLALNLVALAVNLSPPSRAAVGKTSYQELMRDQDFIHAVRSIAESCAVNVDIGKLKC